jgi:hypothetical protein
MPAKRRVLQVNKNKWTAWSRPSSFPRVSWLGDAATYAKENWDALSLQMQHAGWALKPMAM